MRLEHHLGTVPLATIIRRTDPDVEGTQVGFDVAPVGDFFIEMYAIALGKGMHLPEAMSAYRTSSMNSWTTQHNQDKSKNLIKFSKAMKSCFIQMKNDSIFDGFDFSRKLSAADFNIAIHSLLMRDFSSFCRAISNSYNMYPKLSLTQNIFFHLRGFPMIALYLYKLRNR